MKKLFITILLSAAIINTFGQSINYQKSIDEALALAAKNNKPVFVMVTTPIPAAAIPTNTNVIYTTGLDNKEVIDLYNKKFINYQASTVDSAGIKLRDKYHLVGYPTFLFLDTKGQLIYKEGQNSRDPQKYTDMANKALERVASGKTLTYYEQLDKAGTIKPEQLKEYITLKEDLDMVDNSALINRYVDNLTIGSLNDYNTVLFILKAGPYAYSKAYNFAYTNRKITDSIYKQEPLPLRTTINNNIYLNTLNAAIKTKDIRLAQNAASYTGGTHGKDIRGGQKASQGTMMSYYHGINDTTRYFQTAANYYDTYYMNISADSAKKLQQKLLENSLARTQVKLPETTPNANGQTLVSALVAVRVVQGGGQNLDVARQLNSGAFAFFTMGTHNPNYLIKALMWSRRSIELEPRSSYYDTMAHLMYRLNFYDEAILNQNKAVEMAATEKQSKTEQDLLKSELDKMKAHKL